MRAITSLFVPADGHDGSIRQTNLNVDADLHLWRIRDLCFYTAPTCVSSDISSGSRSLCADRYLGNGREILHDGTYRSLTGSLHFWGRYPQGIRKIPNFGPKFWPFNRTYLEKGKSQRYMSTIELNHIVIRNIL